MRWSAWCPDRLALGEGVRFTGDRLVLVDVLAGRLLEADPARPGPLRTLAELDVPLGAVAPVAGSPGSWMAACGTGFAYLRPGVGAPRWLALPESANPLPMRMNDGVADAAGRFWAGSLAFDLTEGAGSLYRVDPDGSVAKVLEGITAPNGPAFTADGTTMYLADSARRRIDRYRVDPRSGALSDPQPFVRLSPGEGTPDGMIVDDEDHLWFAVWDGGCVRRHRTDGTLDRVVRLPARRPTSVAFAGTRLFVSSARYGLRQPTDADGTLFALDVDVTAPPAANYSLP